MGGIENVLIWFYPWAKALHIIAVISWMAGLLYLPRLFVYHCETQPGAPDRERFKIMERRLLRMIANPAMIATFVFGLALLFTPGIVDWSAGWIYAKFAGIAVIGYMHYRYGVWYKALERDALYIPVWQYRIANEIPALAMVVIVIMVTVRPF